MTQEEKELLLRDLCARLPYRVYISPVDCGKAILIGIKDGNPLLWDTIHKKEYDKPWDIEYIKPYLRPMSSIASLISAKEWTSLSGLDLIDWYNTNHIDYRGLIEKGLALEARKGMYNIKEK